MPSGSIEHRNPHRAKSVRRYATRRRASPASDPILKRFRAALDALYGDGIERVVLYGSRARGDAQEDSDYDAYQAEYRREALMHPAVVDSR